MKKLFLESKSYVPDFYFSYRFTIVFVVIVFYGIRVKV